METAAPFFASTAKRNGTLGLLLRTYNLGPAEQLRRLPSPSFVPVRPTEPNALRCAPIRSCLSLPTCATYSPRITFESGLREAVV